MVQTRARKADSRRFKEVLRPAFFVECKAAGLPCWLCDMAIDYDAEPDDYANDSRFQLDHYHPSSTHPELHEDPANFRPSHAGCNRERGNEMPSPSLFGTRSRDWMTGERIAT